MPVREIGRVAGLFRYPVKSMCAEALHVADVSWHGVAGDRRWAFIRGDAAASGFPWLTIRENPRLCLYRPRFVEPERPDKSLTVVRTPSGGDFEVMDPALALELGGGMSRGIRVIKQDRGIFDAMPLSLISTQTLAELAASARVRVDDIELIARRFRPNLLVDFADGLPFAEDALVGLAVTIGDGDTGLIMRVDRHDKRCVIVNVDPLTSERDPAMLRAVGDEHGGLAGMYGSIVRPGRIAVGDPIFAAA